MPTKEHTACAILTFLKLTNAAQRYVQYFSGIFLKSYIKIWKGFIEIRLRPRAKHCLHCTDFHETRYYTNFCVHSLYQTLSES
jgi:hypothetical protein